jgi:hypothetical protein
MKAIIFSLLLLSLISCDKEVKETISNADGTTSTTSPSIGDGDDGTVIDVEPLCTSMNVEGGEIVTCEDGITFISTLTGEQHSLFGHVDQAEGLKLWASKKNGGTGGSLWFNSVVDLDPALDLGIPSSIPVTLGNGGNGQKLYILINNEIDCVWYSKGSKVYRNPRCFTGATRSPGTSLGFSAGLEVSSTEALEVFRLEMELNGSQGDGVVTTASATFTKI